MWLTRHLLFLIVIAGLTAGVDAVVFGGRYRNEIWQDATYRGQAFTREVEYQIHRVLR
jgi:hypothetical protein